MMRSFEQIVDYYDIECDRGTDYRIAEYLLQHVDELERLSTDDIAHGTYVSKSTVSRFVRKHGFDSYDSFIESVRYFNHGNHQINLRLTNDEVTLVAAEPEDYFDAYIDKVCASLVDLKRAVDMADLEELIGLFRTRPAALFAYDQPMVLARELQLGLLRHGMVVQTGLTEPKRAQVAESLGEGSLAVFFSNYGSYINEHVEMVSALKQRGVTLWLITLCYAGPQALLFDKVVRLSPDAYSNAGIYPMKVLVEYLVRRLAFAG